MGKAQTRWLLLAALASGIVLLAVLWYRTSHTLKTPLPSSANAYSEGVAGTFSRINPLYDSFNEVDSDLTALIFSGLTRLGPDGEVLPDLAEGWDVSGDGLAYTFRLRPGVTWHDGQSFSADDILFTYEALQDDDFRGQPERADLFRSITVSKLDDMTVQISLAQPFAPLLAHLTVGILPAHILGDFDAEGLYASNFNQHPVGTGPFRLTEVSADHAVLESYTGYHFGRPYLERLEIRFYPDEAGLMRALEADEVQGAFFRSSLEPTDLLSLEKDADWQVLSLFSTTSTVLYFNNGLPPLQDKKVRQALAYAVDRDAIIATILGNQAVKAESPIAAGTWCYDPVLDRYKFDTAEAARLLDEDGWTHQPGGIRAKAGQQLRLTLVTNEDLQRVAIANTIASNWTALGAPTTVATQTPTTLLRDMLMPHRFLVAIYGFDSGLDPDLYPAYHSSQARAGGDNLSGFSSPQADLLLEEARQSSDAAERKALYRQFQEVFAEEMPSLPLFQPTFTYVVSARLRGLQPVVLFDSSSRFSNVREWHLEGM